MVLIYKRTLNDSFMETKELLEQLGKEVAAQSVWFALLLADKLGIPNWSFLSTKENLKN